MVKKNFPPKLLGAIIYELLLVLCDFLACHPMNEAEDEEDFLFVLLRFCNEKDFF